MKPRVFFFHYNKPASMQAGEARLSVHFRDVCHIVKGLSCLVPCHTKIRLKQPRCVMVGRGTGVSIVNGHATIT